MGETVITDFIFLIFPGHGLLGQYFLDCYANCYGTFSSLETLNFFGISFLWYDINRITCYNLLFMFKEGKVPKNLKKKATKNKRLADIRDAGGRIYEK